MRMDQWLEETYALQTEAFGVDYELFESIRSLAQFLDWNTTAAVQELAELRVEFSWKPWAVDSPFVNRARVIGEIVDCMHFLGNILSALDVTDAEFAEAYTSKMVLNRLRMESKRYSAQKGLLGEGSDDGGPSSY